MTRPAAIPAIALCALACAASSAPAQGEWTLIDRDLHERRIELTQLRDGLLSYIDDTGRAHEQPVTGLLAVVHERPPQDRPPRELPWITRQMELFGQGPVTEVRRQTFDGLLTLADGQRWVGSLVSARGQSITWLIEEAVILEAQLEHIRSAAIRAPIDEAFATWPGLDDRVLLLNRDTLDGFLVQIGPDVRVETDGGDVNLALDRVAGLLLANPPTDLTGIVVRTAGGSVIGVGTVEIAVTGQVSADLGGDAPSGSLSLLTTELRSLLFAPRSIGALAAIEPAEVASPPDHPWTQPPLSRHDDGLGIDSLELQGPVRVEWTLPRPPARFAATATLPPAMWAWGDCEVVVYTGDGREAFRERLNADRPSVEINVPLGGLTGLTIEIDAGRSGPVQDRVVFERPIITWR